VTSPPSAPLDPLTSIKVKLAVLVGVSVLLAAVLGAVGRAGGVPILLTIPVAVAVALGVTQLLAAGMTSPLRQMTEAAQQMARGVYDVRVEASSQDEVGRLAATFNRMAEDLAAVDRERRALIATVSHELRTPLAALAARLENLADGVEQATPETLAEVLAQAQRMGSLVTDLLDLSRVDAGLSTLSLGRVELAAVVQEARADVALPGRAAAYDVQVDQDLVVSADRARLRQLVVNLLDNAVRHGPPGGTVTVAAARTPDGWWLEVRDEGPGVASEDRDRVFERFGTLEGVTGGGTGLGLAVARWVAQLHGGRIAFLDADPDRRGARVRADFPTTVGGFRGFESSSSGSSSTTGVPPVVEETLPTSRNPGRPTANQPVTPPPVLDGIFGAYWPDQAQARRSVVVGAAVAGMLAGAIIPYRDGGIGYAVVLWACGLAVLLSSPHKREPFTLVCGVLGVLLVLPVFLLDAAWIATLCVLAGIVVLIVGVTRGRSVLGFVLAGVSWPLASLRGLPWFGRTLRAFGVQGATTALARTVAFSLLGVLVFGLLFVSADALVASWVDAVLPNWDPDSFVTRGFIGGFVFAVVLAAAYLSLNPPRTEPFADRQPVPVRQRYEWLVPVLLVNAVFLLFLVAQATVVFGGHDYLESTTGLTYADYVHQGFGQLTVATALTLLVVWAAARKAPRATAADVLWLRGALGLLCGLTLVVVASALYRMHVYQEAYGFTRTRLLVDVFEGWLGLLVIGVLVAGLRFDGWWLPRVAVVTGAAALLGLAAINPDAWIARHNLERDQSTTPLDVDYLVYSLSDDAVPELVTGLPGGYPCSTVDTPFADVGDDWLEWNLGRARARDVLDDAGIEPCASAREP
jgi:two-component system sensor histidine kinase BaeS